MPILIVDREMNLLFFNESAEPIVGRRFVTFHHDPAHTDAELDRQVEEASASTLPFELLRGREGTTFEVA